MMRMIHAIQSKVNIQVEAGNLAGCFDYEGFENRENEGEGPSRIKDGEGTCGGSGDTCLGGSDSSESDDGDDEELIVDNPSTNQASKPVCTTVEGWVLEDIDEYDNIDNPIDVSSPVHKSDDEQAPRPEASKERIDRT
ncbi:hypothetical protein L1987_15639 [Smallanthus sonchifolius]|uniref:Uncharacterized protein n=1 Tax=Smallanthus sonchifolius TaxID=185202 RepID=A0ACB9J6N5_9ASTR|nr:hypothetical protein L1987_15639 [Smallanthus sonchifolius]